MFLNVKKKKKVAHKKVFSASRIQVGPFVSRKVDLTLRFWSEQIMLLSRPMPSAVRGVDSYIRKK